MRVYFADFLMHISHVCKTKEPAPISTHPWTVTPTKSKTPSKRRTPVKVGTPEAKKASILEKALKDADRKLDLKYAARGLQAEMLQNQSIWKP